MAQHLNTRTDDGHALRPAASAVLALAAAACGADAPADDAVRREMLGDSVVLTFTAPAETATVERVRTLWRSPELERPYTMARVGDRLVVGDRTRVHILAPADGDPAALAEDGAVTVGRRGEGPGEYRSIRSVGGLGPDTIAVYDSENTRVTYLSPDGERLGSRRITPEAPFINPALGGAPLVPWRGGFLWTVAGGVAIGRVTRHAIGWHDPEADTAAVLEVRDGERLVDLGGVFGPPELFGPRAHFALGAGPRLASGDGLEYCVTVRTLTTDDVLADAAVTTVDGEAAAVDASGRSGGAPEADAGATIRRLCRERPRSPVGDGIRSPDVSVLTDPDRRRMVEAMARNQEVGDLLPSYDRMLLGADGSLWVRTLGPEVAEIHPTVLRARPDLGPSRRLWDVFDVDGEAFVRIVRLPGPFDPRVVTGDGVVYGFHELATGEIVIGAVLPSAVEAAGAG
ncbi:MAG: hypothetical protein ACODAE_01765 [Gemmatimonadota bacterium]